MSSFHFTLGVEDIGGGSYRWRISYRSELFMSGWPAGTDMNTVFRAGLAMIDELRPRPTVREVPPAQQPGSVPPHLMQPATPSEWHQAVTSMPTGTQAPKVRNGFLKGRIAKIANRVGWRCCYCGVALTGSTATIEHLTAQADGGGSEPENLELTCQPCNNERGRMPPDLYLVWRERRGLPIWEGAKKLFAYEP